jgi:hypothetical protein
MLLTLGELREDAFRRGAPDEDARALATTADVIFDGQAGRSKRSNNSKSATPAQPEKRHAHRHVPEVIERIGVSDGIRTRDVQIHSLALYQLSYAHRRNSEAFIFL